MSRLRGLDPSRFDESGERDGDGRYECLGTREQLVDRQIMADGEFPGDAGRPKTQCFVDRTDGRWHVFRLDSKRWGVRYWVQAPRPEREPAPAEEPERMPYEDGWPPEVAHNPAIKRGDGSKWHYLAAGEQFKLAGLLDPDEIPGDPACKYKFRVLGWTDGIPWQATRLGDRVALTLLSQRSAIIYCRPLDFKPR